MIVVIFLALVIAAIVYFAAKAYNEKSSVTSTTTNPATTTTTTAGPQGVRGRYVKVTNKAIELHFSELEVYSPDNPALNIARGKTVQASSELPEYPWVNVVDGNPANFGHGKGLAGDWMMVDLGSVYYIDKIVIRNRVDCCQGRILGSKVSIHENNPTVGITAMNPVWTSDAFKSKTGAAEPLPFPDTSGWMVYTMRPPSTIVTGSDA